MVETVRFGCGSGWWQRLFLVVGVISSVCLPCLGSSLTPYLSDAQSQRIKAILNSAVTKLSPALVNECYAIAGFHPEPGARTNLEALEKCYQFTVQRQTYADLAAVYAPENAAKVKITYGSFRMDGEFDPLGDLGFGLHVVRRLALPLPDGGTKIVEVNEQWLQNPIDGGLFLPDEIRVKSLAFEGPRRVPGSEKLYLFDSFRVGWGQYNAVAIARRTRFDYVKKLDSQTKRPVWANQVKQMRVPVSSPLSCVGCHHGFSKRADRFLQPGESVNHEAIVQDRYFDKPLAETFGYRGYIAALEAQHRPTDFIAKVKAALLKPAETLALPATVPASGNNSASIPGIVDTLKAQVTTFQWLGGDYQLDDTEADVHRNRRSVYCIDTNGNDAESPSICYRDAVEDLHEGTYLWWTPESAFPPVAGY